jgi:polysaccharide biosynthesis transport protein
VEAGRIELLDAALPGVPVGATRRAKLLFGLVVGLALGAGAAYLIDGINTSIRGRDELQTVLNLPSLALIPQLAAPTGARLRALSARLTGRAGNGRAPLRPKELVTVSDPRSMGAEAFRTLRMNILFSQSDQAVRTLVVTSACPSEGKSTTAANLGVAFAQQGLRVLLVDCDLRRASLHHSFGLTQTPGLTQMLMADPDAGSRAIAAGPAIRSTAIDGLFVLPAGPLPPNPAELLGSNQMRSTLDALSSGYDMVILDTPPVLVASDAAILSKSVDGVVFVVCAGRTDRDAARQAVEHLTSVGARILGAALNDPDAKLPRYRYGGYYQFDYAEKMEARG